MLFSVCVCVRSESVMLWLEANLYDISYKCIVFYIEICNEKQGRHATGETAKRRAMLVSGDMRVSITRGYNIHTTHKWARWVFPLFPQLDRRRRCPDSETTHTLHHVYMPSVDVSVSLSVWFAWQSVIFAVFRVPFIVPTPMVHFVYSDALQTIHTTLRRWVAAQDLTDIPSFSLCLFTYVLSVFWLFFPSLCPCGSVSQGGFIVPTLRKMVATDREQVMRLIAIGQANRTVRCSNADEACNWWLLLPFCLAYAHACIHHHHYQCACTFHVLLR